MKELIRVEIRAEGDPLAAMSWLAATRELASVTKVTATVCASGIMGEVGGEVEIGPETPACEAFFPSGYKGPSFRGTVIVLKTELLKETVEMPGPGRLITVHERNPHTIGYVHEIEIAPADDGMAIDTTPDTLDAKTP